MERPKNRRSFSYALRQIEALQEEERLLPDAENGEYYSGHDVPVPPNPHAHLPVYTTIHR